MYSGYNDSGYNDFRDIRHFFLVRRISYLYHAFHSGYNDIVYNDVDIDISRSYSSLAMSLYPEYTVIEYLAKGLFYKKTTLQTDVFTHI